MQNPDFICKSDFRCKASPTLILWGEQDRIIPTVHAEDFARHISHSRVEVLPRSGHLPMLEQPDEFVRLVVEFLAE